MLESWVISDWIRHAAIRKKFVIDEFEKGNVELGEGAHDFVINIKWKSLVEFIWADPGDLLTHDFNSVVDTFNGVEGFREALTHRAVKHKVTVELAANFEVFLFNFECQMLRELRKQ